MSTPRHIGFNTALLFAWFILGLLTGHSYDKERPVAIDSESLELGAVEERVLVTR